MHDTSHPEFLLGIKIGTSMKSEGCGPLDKNDLYEHTGQRIALRAESRLIGFEIASDYACGFGFESRARPRRTTLAGPCCGHSLLPRLTALDWPM